MKITIIKNSKEINCNDVYDYQTEDVVAMLDYDEEYRKWCFLLIPEEDMLYALKATYLNTPKDQQFETFEQAKAFAIAYFRF